VQPDVRAFDAEAVGAAVRQPPLAELSAALRARRRRRGTALVVVAVVAAIAVGTAAPLAMSGSGPPASPPGDRALTRVVLLEGDAAVAVRVRRGGCDVALAATEDFGRTWSPFRQVRFAGFHPEDHRNACETNIVAEPLGARSYLVTVDHVRTLLSTDQGRTWRDAKPSIVVVDRFPAGAKPLTCRRLCADQKPAMAVDPLSGAVYRLRVAPLPEADLSATYAAPDGSFWAAYTNYSERPMIARSTDRGWTWRTLLGPLITTVTSLVARDGTVAYALVESTLHRTTDGGQTWAALPADLPPGLRGRPLAIAADGSLIVFDGPNAQAPRDCHDRCDEGDLYAWTSADGRHFTRGPKLIGHIPVDQAGPVRIVRRDGDDLMVSPDGITWRRLPLPG
jgi:photosystem II stability/assembly factor-like uncharacterized protein